MKTFIGINVLTSIESIVYSNHIQFFYRLGKHYPNDTFAINTPRRMGIDRMRNQTAKFALENDYDYVMFIDDDVIIPINALEALYKADKDIVAGWTIIRGYPFDNMSFKYNPEDKAKLEVVKKMERHSGLIDVDAVGFSCVLIKTSLLKNTPQPWFVTGPYNTEDVYFCVKARKYNPDCTIAVDTSVETAHLLGPEIIAPWNKEDYKLYSEKQEPILLKTAEELKKAVALLGDSGDRGEAYLEMVKAHE